MSQNPNYDRRRFLQLAAGTVAFAIGDQLVLAANAPASVQNSTAGQIAQRLPRFEGTIVFDVAACEARAIDFGRSVHKVPMAVLLPRSTGDVQKLVQFCNKEKIKIGVRGSGGSAYGQTLVDQGFVIDFSSMNKLKWVSPGIIEAQPGATWYEVQKFAIQRGMTPPVLPDTMFITVGGTLNGGGIGETSYRYGAQVDHVDSVEVVLGDGTLTACSEEQNKELFRYVLASMGQTAVITRARIRVVQAPPLVASRDIHYRDLGAFLNDTYQVALREPQGAVAAHAVVNPEGGWNLILSASNWVRSQAQAEPQWLTSLKNNGDVKPTKITSYDEYANRNTQGYLDAVKSGALLVPHPYVSFYVPADKAQSLLQYILSTPDAHLGARRVAVFALFNLNFDLPLHRVPKTVVSYHIRIYRLATKVGDADHLRMLANNVNEIVPRVLAAGGTFYLPFTPLLNKKQIEQHYSTEIFSYFSKAKRRLDPNGILNPGAGIF